MFFPMSWTSPFTVMRKHDLALRADDLSARRERRLLLFHERGQVGDRLLHHARGLDDLREEHLAGAEEIAHNAHPVHERSLDDGERAPQLRARLLRVRVDEGVDPLHEGVGEARLHRPLPPLLFFLLGGGGAGPLRLEALAEVDEPLGRVGASVEEDVFDELAELGGDLLVDLEHAGVDDAHVHAGLDGVEDERRVHRLADVVIATEAERDVGDAAAHLRVRQVRLDPARRVHEVDGVVVVLLDASGDREDVRVEDDVLGREADHVDEEPIGALADADLVLVGSGLAFLVECHATTTAAPYLRTLRAFSMNFSSPSFSEMEFTMPLPWRHLRPASMTSHLDESTMNGTFGHLRLLVEEEQEAGHRGDSVDHPFVHADVDDVRPVFDLLARDAHRFFEGFLDELCKPR